MVARQIARTLGRVVERSLVLDRDLHRDHVAGAHGARIAEEIGASVLPERIVPPHRLRRGVDAHGRSVGIEARPDRCEVRLATEVGDLVGTAAEQDQSCERHDRFCDHERLSPVCDLTARPGKFTLAAPAMVAARRAA